MPTKIEVLEGVRSKYPEYNEIGDDELYTSLVAKYPEYAETPSDIISPAQDPGMEPETRAAIEAKKVGQFPIQEPLTVGQELGALGTTAARMAFPAVSTLIPTTDQERTVQEAIGQEGLNAATLGTSNTLADMAGVDLNDPSLASGGQAPISTAIGSVLGNAPGIILGGSAMKGLAQAFPNVTAKIMGVATLFPKTAVSLASGATAYGQGAVLGTNEALQKQEEKDFQKALKQGLNDAKLNGAVGLVVPGSTVLGAKFISATGRFFKPLTEAITATDENLLRRGLRPKYVQGRTESFGKQAKESSGEIYAHNPDADQHENGAVYGFWQSASDVLKKTGQKLNELRKTGGQVDYDGTVAFDSAKKNIESAFRPIFESRKKLDKQISNATGAEKVRLEKLRNDVSSELDKAEAIITPYNGLKFNPEQLQEEVTQLNNKLSPFWRKTEGDQQRFLSDPEKAALKEVRDHLSNALDDFYNKAAKGSNEGAKLRSLYGATKAMRDHAEKQANDMFKKVPPELQKTMGDMTSTGELLFGLGNLVAGNYKTAGVAITKGLLDSKISSLRKEILDQNSNISRWYQRMRSRLPVEGKIKTPPVIPPPQIQNNQGPTVDYGDYMRSNSAMPKGQLELEAAMTGSAPIPQAPMSFSPTPGTSGNYPPIQYRSEDPAQYYF